MISEIFDSHLNLADGKKVKAVILDGRYNAHVLNADGQAAIIIKKTREDNEVVADSNGFVDACSLILPNLDTVDVMLTLFSQAKEVLQIQGEELPPIPEKPKKIKKVSKKKMTKKKTKKK